MVFTTQIFLFVFFPLCMAAYMLVYGLERCQGGRFLQKIRARDLILIVFSLGFYMWACFENVFRLLIYVGAVYLMALWVEMAKKNGRRRYPLAVSAALLVICLVYCSYFSAAAAPLGISFITFSAISYLVDIYRENGTAGSLIDCGLYLTFFPKVASGPIVLWKDFQPQIGSQRITLAGSVSGINRIMIGFAKKLILADSFGACLAEIGSNGIDRVTAAGTLILYMLQIYYDFSGYSDIAIGLSWLFGFEVKENFNFPYRSCSISEFWRRWHISLGTWFREYVYFPLGGSRAGSGRTLCNLAIVFALTGIWHGAGWNYALWGFINGAFVVLERVIQDKRFYRKTPKTVKYIITMVVVMLFWQLFRFPLVADVGNTLGILFGTVHFPRIPYTWKHFFDVRMLVFMGVGLIGSTLAGSPAVVGAYRRAVSTRAGCAVQEAVLLALFVLSILFMVNSTYSPFIYFQY